MYIMYYIYNVSPQKARSLLKKHENLMNHSERARKTAKFAGPCALAVLEPVFDCVDCVA